MAKSYSVVMGEDVMYGPVPESKYEEIQQFITKLAPTIRAKCKVRVEDGGKSAAESPEVKAPIKKEAEPPKTVKTGVVPSHASEASKAPTAKVGQPLSSVDDRALNDRFSSFLEGGGGSGLWKPKDGRNYIRILPIGGVHPSDWKTPYPFVLAGFHSKVGLSMQDTVVCPRLTFQKACPICQFIWNLYKSKDPSDTELAKQMKAYQRIIANIIDLNDVEKGVQKFGFGKKLAEKIAGYMNDEEFMPLLDPDKGHNFIVVKKMADGFPNYDDSRPEVKVSSINQVYPQWREEAKDLKADIIEKSWDELLAVLEATKKAIVSTSMESMAGSVRTPVQSGSPAGGRQAVDDSEPPPVGFKEEPQSNVSEISLDELSRRIAGVQGQ